MRLRVFIGLVLVTLAGCWAARGQQIIGFPVRPLSSAADVVTTPPTNNLYFWYQVDKNPYSDGAQLTVSGTQLTNSSLASAYALNSGGGGTQFPLYSNNVINGKSAIFWTNTPSTIFAGDTLGPTTITGWTLVIVFKVPTPNVTYQSTVPVWSFSANDRGLYYNILSAGTGQPQYWLYCGSTQALITSSNDWQIVSTRFQYSVGSPEIRDNASTVTGSTASIANETVRNPRLSGVGSFGVAGPDGCAEVLFYTNRLSDADLILARRYLTNKYAIVATP